MGIFEHQNKDLQPPLIIIIINYCVFIINAYHNFAVHNVIIIFLIKVSSRNAIRKKIWQLLGLLLLPV